VGLQYKIVYKLGASNQATDALSRHPSPSSQVHAISSVTPTWLTGVVAGSEKDPAALKLTQELSLAPDSHRPYTLTDGVLRLRDRIWIGNNTTLQQRLMSAMHTSAVCGHSGFPVTFSKLKKLFAWCGMKTDVKSFVVAGSVCVQGKPNRARYPSLLAPLLVPTESWQVLSMDFIEGLPRSGAANCLMVVLDRFSKFAHFIPLLHPFTAQQVAQAFLDNIYRLHGLPTVIASSPVCFGASSFALPRPHCP